MTVVYLRSIRPTHLRAPVIRPPVISTVAQSLFHSTIFHKAPLPFRRRQVADELAETEHEITRVEAALREKDPYRKLAETRLERRTERPTNERVYDPPWSALREEATTVQVWGATIRSRETQTGLPYFGVKS